MTEFSTIISEKWDLSQEVADAICVSWKEGNSIYYLVDYVPLVSAELDLGTLGAIFDFLDSVSALDSKKKRVLNALKKAGDLDEEAEDRVKHCYESVELDDMLLPYRPNSRSKSNIAIKKGLGELADTIDLQEITDKTPEELAEEYIGKDPSLKTVDDVLAGVKDILVERFAYDETVRQMVRDFGYDDGFVEVTPKNKKDKKYLKYRGQYLGITELDIGELAMLLEAESNKEIRLKYGVQLFRIIELLRHHFIEDPESQFFDFLCEVIDECWTKSLRAVVEKHVKSTVRETVQEWALKQINKDLENLSDTIDGSSISVSFVSSRTLVIVAFNSQGNLLGATKEERSPKDTSLVSKRIRQFASRYRPKTVFVIDNDYVKQTETLVKKSLNEYDFESVVVSLSEDGGLSSSPWMVDKYSDLDNDMRIAYAIGLTRIKPFSLISQIGVGYFSIHPLQKHVEEDTLKIFVERKSTELMLHNGVSVMNVVNSVLINIPGVKLDILSEIRKSVNDKKLTSKNDILNVSGVTESIFKNIAGYIILPNAENILDRTLVHPDFHEWVADIAGGLGVSVETLVSNPEQIKNLTFDNFSEKVFADKKLISQLKIGQKFARPASSRPKRRSRLSEIKEGRIISGRVTNVTEFGVFVDINATCDGLVHISQLADGYVETPDQVVHQGQQIDVRVITVDVSKKRISLSMKNLGERSPKIRPSNNQLTNLADHFKNR